MKTIEIPQNTKRVIFELDNGEKQVKELNNMPFVPKEIGINSDNDLIFNSGKSVLYECQRFYGVITFSYKIKNTNNGSNYTYEKTTFGELEYGDIFVPYESEMVSDDLIDYEIKINSDESVCINKKDIIVSETKNDREVYKIVKI